MRLFTLIFLSCSCLANAAIFSFSGTLSQRSASEGNLDGLDGATVEISFQTTNIWETGISSSGVALGLIANSLKIEISDASLAIQNGTYTGVAAFPGGGSLYLDTLGDIETSSGSVGFELANMTFAELFLLRYRPEGELFVEDGDPVTSNQFSSDPTTVSTNWEGISSGSSPYNFTPTSASFAIPEPSVALLLPLSGIVLLRRQRYKK